MSNTEQPKGRKPDFLAYNVTNDREGNAHFNNVGAAWQHKDGKGVDVQLHSTPVNGRITLREQRDQQIRDFQQQGNQPDRAQSRQQSRQNQRHVEFEH